MKTLKTQNVNKKKITMIENSNWIEIHVDGRIVGLPVTELTTANYMFSAVINTLQMIVE